MAYDSTGNRSAQSKSSPSSLSNGNPFEMPTYQLHFRSIFGLLASASAFNLMVGQVASGCGTGHVDVNGIQMIMLIGGWMGCRQVVRFHRSCGAGCLANQ